MKNEQGNLAAPFPWFGGKSGCVDQVWQAFGDVANYVEPFAGSAAMLLGAPDFKRVETINDADGFVSNFWRAISHDSAAVATYADWPVNETDLFARHSWLVNSKQKLLSNLHGDPYYYDAKIAGWWVWGLCAWIGGGWCSGTGPWVHDGNTLVKGNSGQGINRQMPHLGDSGRGINRKMPHLGDSGRGINRQMPHLGDSGRGIQTWFLQLQQRLRNVRVCCGDWARVVSDAVTTRHGVTGIFLDPPYTKGAMDYAAGGVGGELAQQVQNWCKANGQNKLLKIVLCGHAGEHDELLNKGWTKRHWKARKGYALSDDAIANSASETIWCSPHCVPETGQLTTLDLFAETA